MKKHIKVIRSAGKTMVIYSDPPKHSTGVSKMVPTQKPVPVFLHGVLSYYIMPSGRCLPVRRGFFWKLLKFIRPRSFFAAV